MKQKLLGLFIVIVAFLGILDATYVTYQESQGIIPPCTPPFSCGQVLESKWSHIGPVPISAIGVLYYSFVFGFGVVLFLGTRIIHYPKKVSVYVEDLLLTFTSCGLLFSMYLIFIMAFVLQAWCLYCLLSASFCILLFGMSFLLHRELRSSRQNPRLPLRRSLFRALYQWCLKPLYFLLDAEFVHTNMTTIGNVMGKFLVLRSLTAWLFAYSDKKLEQTIDGIVFPNPVGLSAGFDYNAELPGILPSVGFGFATIGTVTNEPYEGNRKPRLGRFPKSQALVVNKGFKSLGAKAIIKKLEGHSFAIPIGISIGSTNKNYDSLGLQIENVVAGFKQFEASKVAHSYYELNISCPNTAGGQPFTTPARLKKLLVALQKLHISKPIYIKMPIDLQFSEVLPLLELADSFNIHGVIFGNLTKDKNNPDVHPADKKSWKNIQGNLSGKPTWNRSNNLIQMTKKTFGSRFTIIGAGGIFTPEDAQFKLSLGADLVELITGMIYEGPQLIGAINEYIRDTKVYRTK